MRTKSWLIFALALSASPAAAAGINLGWDDCPAGPTYALTQTFACDTNTGAHTLVGSFVATAGVEKMSANEMVIDLQSSGAAFPDWWGMNSGSCRSTSLALNVDFTGGPSSCYDYWQGGAVGGIQMRTPVGNRVRIPGVYAIPANDPHITAVPEGLHVYSFKAVINNAKTVGLGSCAGCNTDVCIVLQWITLDQPVGTPAGNIRLTNPATAQHVIWQGWSDPSGNCPQVTPAKNRTWGSIKALYR